MWIVLTQITMIVAALWFLTGAGLNAGAQHLWMLVVGEGKEEGLPSPGIYSGRSA
jgi:hypothetical protein